MRARALAVVAVVAMTWGVSGCGGGDEAGDAPNPAAEADASAGGAGDSAEAGSSNDATGDDGGDESGDDASGSPVTVGGVTGFSDECEDAINFVSVTGQVLSGQVSVATASQYLEGFLAAMSDELRPAAELFATTYLAFAEAMDEYAGDLGAASTDPDVMAQLETLGSSEMSSAAEEITEFLAAECNWGGM